MAPPPLERQQLPRRRSASGPGESEVSPRPCVCHSRLPRGLHGSESREPPGRWEGHWAVAAPARGTGAHGRICRATSDRERGAGDTTWEESWGDRAFCSSPCSWTWEAVSFLESFPRLCPLQRRCHSTGVCSGQRAPASAEEGTARSLPLGSQQQGMEGRADGRQLSPGPSGPQCLEKQF